MPLRITLKPHERLIINGAAIRNGDRAADLLIETQCRFLRESEIIRESEADTAAKRLCVTLQVIYLADNPAEVEDLLVRQSTEILRAMPSAAPYLLAIQDEVAARRYHRALKCGRDLVAHERTLLCGGPRDRIAAPGSMA
ncbi:flagellar biosynthesis repressor FlbT [Methylobacterium nodulans]|uniref:Flagellar FlbT family protein n=1 Tax=Methylobacterium nodulans (strain LMG 21967 / CNCM I-2342 / ORS 2060) TaxID=460265 RepID=B8INF8_METNO|nr:flagellar biosynthesis repressor FlbT [Methylobacterium nodulans]ACL56484.1 flagellar FlbT family protein [Methylobacterium nodulans ORS 2060]